MNKKTNEGWTLCPSKRFPGKYYYFNVINGEAVWCLTEAEQKSIKGDSIKRVLETHSYPEPTTPPTKEASNPYNFTSPTIPYNYHLPTHQMFGRPVFPKYIPHEYVPSYVLPMPPMFVANRPETILVSDQLTQTSDAGDVVVHCSAMSLSKRFGAYSQAAPTKVFDNGFCTINNNNNWWSKGPEKNSFSVPQGSMFGPNTNRHNLFTPNTNNTMFAPTFAELYKNDNKIIKDPVLRGFNSNEIKETNDNLCNSKVNQSGYISTTSIGCQVENSNVFTNKASSIDNQKTSMQSPMDIMDIWLQNSLGTAEKSILNPGNNVDIPDGALEQNDLRLVLKARRRKLQGENKAEQVNETTKKPANITNVPVKKQVTFDVPSSTEEEIESIEESVMQESESSVNETAPRQILDVLYLNSLSEPFHKPDLWYIVVDMGVLLDNFEFIDNFVKKDPSCRLLVPNSVRVYMQTISVGQYCGRGRMMAARKASRRLASPSPWLVLQPPILDSCTSSAIDAIIECCKQISQRHHAVLVTSDSELYNKGISTGIHTFKISDIKANSQEEVTFNIRKVFNNNMFLQDTDEFESLAVNNKDLPTYDPVFKVPNMISKAKKTPVKVDACTSPVIFNKKTNKTRDLNSEMNQNDVNSDSSIEENIKSLSLKENSTIEEQTGCGNLKYSKLKFRKVIVNPNCVINKEQCLNSNPDPQKPQKIVLRRHNFQNSNVHPQKTVRKIILNRNHLRTVKNTDFKSAQSTNVTENSQSNSAQSINVTENPHFISAQTTTLAEIPQFKSTQRINVTDTPQFKLTQRINVTETPQFKSAQSTVTEKPKIKITHIETIKPQTKNIPEERLINLIDEGLKKFQVANTTIKRRIECRLEEWMCCYRQIMEEALSTILMNNLSNSYKILPAPWSLQEAIICLKELYTQSENIKKLADRYCDILNSAVDEYDKQKKSLKAADFMMLFGYGVLLVEALKKILPQSEELKLSEDSLKCLLAHIQDPTTDLEMPTNHTPIHRDVDDMELVDRHISPKKPSEIIEYLKRYYPAWKDYVEEEPTPERNKTKSCIQGQERNVIQTFGRRLNIKINNAKRITFDNDFKIPKKFDKTNNLINASEFKENEKIERNVNNKMANIFGAVEHSRTEYNNIIKNYNFNSVSKNLNNARFNEGNVQTSKDGSSKNTQNSGFEQKSNVKITRNAKIIEEYEKQNVDRSQNAFENENRANIKVIRKANKINDYEMKISDINRFETDLSERYFKPNIFLDNDNYSPFLNDFAQTNDNFSQSNDNFAQINEHFAQPNDKFASDDIDNNDNAIVYSDTEAQSRYTQNNDSISLYDGVNDNDAPVNDVNEDTNDSGFENDGLQTCAFIRKFLIELSGSFKVIYSFIDNSIQEFHDEMKEDAKKELYDRANETHLHVADIIGKLKVIIEREAAENTKLKTLIINAGVDALTDKRMTRYRQVVTKCLEQAQLLAAALQGMLALSDQRTHADTCHIAYFNIFE